MDKESGKNTAAESASTKDLPPSIPLPLEKSAFLNKSSSFTAHDDRPRSRPQPRRALSSVNEASVGASDDELDGERDYDKPEPTLDEVSREIDAFIEMLSSTEDKTKAEEVPQSVEKFTSMVRSEIDKYESEESSKFGQDSNHDTLVTGALSRVYKLIKLLESFPSGKPKPSLLLLIDILQRAMSIMEEDFRRLLEDSMNPPSSDNIKTPKSGSSEACKTPKSVSSEASKTPKSVSLEASKTPKSHEAEWRVLDKGLKLAEEKNNEDEEICPGMSQEMINTMKTIAGSMISSGYETECLLTYKTLRRIAFKEAIKEQGLQKLSIDEVQKMNWEPLETHITTWVKVVKHVAKVLLPREKRLCQTLFSSPSIVEDTVANFTRSVMILFFNFAEAVAMTKRSAERLFKVLDTYEALTGLTSAIDELIACQETADELRSEISSVKRRLGEASVCIFCDLENSIKNDVARSPVPNGAVHPLTRYTMNYIRYAGDFKQTLEEVFSLHQITEQRLEQLEPQRDSDDAANSNSNNNANAASSQQSPFAFELMTIMNLLEANLEEKSKLYKDPSLRYIFLMNNGRYIIQKIRESTEIHGLVDDEYRRRKAAELRGYHKSYQRETWGKVLQCLNQEGLQVHGKVHKPVLKERFNNFNKLFDEIQRTQSSWVVSDDQLQSELQVSISAVMIPAYRSFLGRFGQIFTPGRQYEKYVKYQPEDIESAIEGLFDGNQNLSMARRK